ncbi:rRNA adenine methyltransferase [Spirosoma utsteinense]|uniref:Rifampin ADP-ribosylating transferase n=1 Tax=Spirosoma utsteinense TaxID=2585773 RepID=A0ABR6WEX7_9BACT|nr:rRNA adenine methyltransferase [Spirosoma utsteinense]MBC3789146.1 rifampin ADP-ribosylating transferase [Spirosoma utsteinense]MBC3795081.1 rifampin ADP-ribosylating transferase [Spirosoma utsteinense]
MPFDPTNPVIQLCAKGIEIEAESPDQAKGLFLQAWSLAATDVEKFTAAHYLARHQDSATEKLEWDLRALQLALQIQDESITSSYPSLYLNVGKGYEDLGDIEQAKHHYQLALSYVHHLPTEGYGKMIKQGVESGLKRLII